MFLSAILTVKFHENNRNNIFYNQPSTNTFVCLCRQLLAILCRTGDQ